MVNHFTLKDCCRVVRTQELGEEFHKFWRSVMDALVNIINEGSTSALYYLSDRLLTKSEFDALLDSTGICNTLKQLADYLPDHANCALYPDFPEEKSIHDMIIQSMPFVFYTLKRIQAEETDTVRSALNRQVIIFRYTRLKDRYAIVSYFSPPNVM
jgi:hypothetical protein